VVTGKFKSGTPKLSETIEGRGLRCLGIGLVVCFCGSCHGYGPCFEDELHVEVLEVEVMAANNCAFEAWPGGETNAEFDIRAIKNQESMGMCYTQAADFVELPAGATGSDNYSGGPVEGAASFAYIVAYIEKIKFGEDPCALAIYPSLKVDSRYENMKDALSASKNGVADAFYVDMVYSWPDECAELYQDLEFRGNCMNTYNARVTE
jgi:hypothetical protein